MVNISISILVTFFAFFLFLMIKGSNLKALLKRIDSMGKDSMGKTGLGKKVVQWRSTDDLKLLFEEEGGIKLFKLSIKSLQELFFLRIALSLAFFVGTILFGLLFKKNFVLYALGSSLIFYFLPPEIVKGKVNDRRKKILDELPDIIDILSSLINAGLSLDEAINYISLNFKGEVSRLFRLIKVKIWEGYSKREACYRVARLSFCSDFNTIVKLLVQSDMVGNPIKDVLKDLSRMIRNNQRDMLKMRAERLEGNLTLVVFIFVFIPMLILFLLPVLPQLKMFF